MFTQSFISPVYTAHGISLVHISPIHIAHGNDIGISGAGVHLK